MQNPPPAPTASRRAPAPGPGERPASRATHHSGEHRNEILLAGRVTAEPSVRELPSGDQLVTWRIAVTRPQSEQRPNQPADPITCVSFRRDMAELTRDWRIGDTVQVTGALRRRFWRSPNGSASVFEVEAKTACRVGAAA
ncbi:single-stranded DNA-binding protein [Actinorugispora endophytica]|uniref:Single-strand DNA-binding protein n=1 Tax=Actinorugispora endophytica TaxID=1605990 RepID=A0A4R6UKM1_9ACTN|nr:single-stranded DNA-binding protein [Actinorugispora endophytica]TDQ47538.1 single-strand DNA-binding protein [Actinorugispora endophytica]